MSNLVAMLIVWLLAAPVVAAPPDLTGLTSWMYQLQGRKQDLSVTALANANFPLVVTDYSADGSAAKEFTCADITAIKTTRTLKLVLAYISIGEASNFRYYWPVNPALLAPSPNPQFPESSKVRYWLSAWQDIIFGTPSGPNKSYLDRIIDQCFDGIYLDIIDAYEYWGPREIGGTNENRNAARDMIDFVTAMANYARVTRGKPDFLVVPQNGSGIIFPDAFPDNPSEAATKRAQYFSVINGIGAEDTFYFGSLWNNNKLNQQTDVINNLAAFTAAGKKVFSVDYLSAFAPNPKQLPFPAAAIDYYDRALAQQYAPLTSERDLDVIVADPFRVPGQAYVADLVVGQPDFTSRAMTLGAAGLAGPTGAASDGTHLWIADRRNNRVLGWNTIPATNGAAADVVLGQLDFTHRTAGGSASKLSGPTDVDTDGTRLFIADTSNNRVLIYSTLPATNAAAADLVIGHPDFTGRLPGTTAATMRQPAGVDYDGTRLFVADTGNNRVLIFNTLPAANGAPADVVIGQSDFITRAAGTAGVQLRRPMGVYSDGARLFVADGGNHRVLIYDPIPTTNGAEASLVIGQDDFGLMRAGSSRERFRQPSAVALAPDGTLLVADHLNNRLLLFDSVVNGSIASDVIGQSAMDAHLAHTTATGLRTVRNVRTLGTALLVVDEGNNRVLRFVPSP